ncbi:MAG: alkyl hydroperoxide reductase/Thiol specific antioxidant/Mal allergen [Chloroflexi bacterium]|nr:alkyl hydroperoxide reductase/Thiol specific antioxidant/Mal allergen [Chloroflexota bacterium]
MTSVDDYNIETYYREINNAARAVFPSAPLRVGHRAPAFELPEVDGGAIRLESLTARGHVVLIFGCFTAPPCIAQLPALETMHRTYGGREISFVFVYTREIHPGENFPPHRTIEQKLEQARRMRDHARISFPVTADALDGSVHLAYGGLPSMAIVVHRDGTLVYRGEWTVAPVIRIVLEDLLRQDKSAQLASSGRRAYHEWISPMDPEPIEAQQTILELAGPKSRADYDRANANRLGRRPDA